MAPEISGHPALELEPEVGSNPVVITLCAFCGEMRSVLWLTKDRWICRSCKAEGLQPPNMYPIA